MIRFPADASALSCAYAKRLGTMDDTSEVAEAPGCTTHFSLIDLSGNMVAYTQTLLSIFGSRVVSPGTGLLMTNGTMWFDLAQGKPNSLGANNACLMNVCPVLGQQDARRFALDASGGRKIVSAVAQLASFIADNGMDIKAAFHAPRIDVSGGDSIIADETLLPEVQAALGEVMQVQTTQRIVLPYAFACPAGVKRDRSVNTGCTEIMSPWRDAPLEEDP